MRALVLSKFVLVLAFLMGSPAMSAQSADEAAVAEAVESFRKAVLSKDRKQFEALIADQLIYGHSDGRIETKAEYIKDATGPRSAWKVIDLTDHLIKVTGNTAIARHNYTGESEREGGKIQSTKIGVLMIWQKQGADWKLLTRMSYPR